MVQKALIIDDDRTITRLITRILETQFYFKCIQAGNGREGLACLEETPDISVVIMDLNMPVMDGRETLQHIVKAYPHIPVIILTGSNEMNDAVKMIKEGAQDFLSKPIDEARLVVSFRNAIKTALMTKKIDDLQKEQSSIPSFSDLVGYDAGLKPCIDMAKKAAGVDIPVLIYGETGTGKEMMAKAIHGQSHRNHEKFIAINCGAIPEKLVESTLFGHEKGAFTGATQKSLGKFQEASGGTIFLDEIAELSLEAQVGLLRVLQEQEVEPVGSAYPVKIDVRIVSATHKNLAEEVKAGRFREDLYFRLNILHLTLPSLRDRKDDISNLANHFIQSFGAMHNMPMKKISDDAMGKLIAYDWPGNVRELENMMNRAMVMSDGMQIMAHDLFFENARGDESAKNRYATSDMINTVLENGNLKQLKDMEIEIITMALVHNNNNVTKTARDLGVAKSTIYAKVPDIKDNR